MNHSAMAQQAGTDDMRVGMRGQHPWIAFLGQQCIAKGAPQTVAAKVVEALAPHGQAQAALLVFDARSSHLQEVDWRGSLADVLARLPAPAAAGAPAQDGVASSGTAISTADGSTADGSAANPVRGAGRPKLGVVAREVTLLPRHWDWLAQQSGGASVVLRKLVEEASRVSKTQDDARQRTEAAYRFMHAIGGDLAGFEEATRALFAADWQKLDGLLNEWPRDIAQHVNALIQENRT